MIQVSCDAPGCARKETMQVDPAKLSNGWYIWNPGGGRPEQHACSKEHLDRLVQREGARLDAQPAASQTKRQPGDRFP